VGWLNELLGARSSPSEADSRRTSCRLIRESIPSWKNPASPGSRLGSVIPITAAASRRTWVRTSATRADGGHACTSASSAPSPVTTELRPARSSTTRNRCLVP